MMSLQKLSRIKSMHRLSRPQRDRLMNASLFFAGQTAHCGLAKLCRLLYLTDVHHFQETGTPMTGERYCAWSFGPAPEALYGTIDRSDSAFREWFELNRDPSIDFYGARLIPKRPWTIDNFTPRQAELMGQVAVRHQADHYGDIELDSDLDAYRITWHHGRGKSAVIPYELTVSPNSPLRAAVLERYREDNLHGEAMQQLLGRHAA